MKLKITPGPWEVTEDGEGIFAREEDIRIVNQMLGHACSGDNLDRTDEELEANARLIAAAPDLLMAAGRIARSQECVSDCSPHPDAGLHVCMVCALKAAIAKAEGR